jgi:predicted dehydrogenase
MSSPVRAAVVGLGYWGPHLARNLHDIEEAELVAICDADESRLAAVGHRYQGARCYSKFEDLLADDGVEAIGIATPVSTHFRLANAALAAGKHVLVEKPLAASSTEALGLIETAQDNNVVLMPGHTFLYSPPVRMIRDLVQSGELGEIYFVSTSRVNLGLHQSDVSVAWDLGPHDFSILRFWLGETPSYASAVSRGCVFEGTPDVAFINFGFPSGTIANVELSWLAPSKLRRTTIVGSRKMVVYDDTSTEPVRVFDSGVIVKDPETFGEYTLTYRTGDVLSPHVDPVEPLASEMRDFCSAIRAGTIPTSSSTVGLEVVRMIEAVDASLQSSGRRIDLDGDLAWTPAKEPQPEDVTRDVSEAMRVQARRRRLRQEQHLA